MIVVPLYISACVRYIIRGVHINFFYFKDVGVKLLLLFAMVGGHLVSHILILVYFQVQALFFTLIHCLENIIFEIRQHATAISQLRKHPFPTIYFQDY